MQTMCNCALVLPEISPIKFNFSLHIFNIQRQEFNIDHGSRNHGQRAASCPRT